jgi:hypothetical protein
MPPSAVGAVSRTSAPLACWRNRACPCGRAARRGANRRPRWNASPSTRRGNDIRWRWNRLSRERSWRRAHLRACMAMALFRLTRLPAHKGVFLSRTNSRRSNRARASGVEPPRWVDLLPWTDLTCTISSTGSYAYVPVTVSSSIRHVPHLPPAATRLPSGFRQVMRYLQTGIRAAFRLGIAEETRPAGRAFQGKKKPRRPPSDGVRGPIMCNWRSGAANSTRPAAGRSPRKKMPRPKHGRGRGFSTRSRGFQTTCRGT